jgi:hypothetical protein
MNNIEKTCLAFPIVVLQNALDYTEFKLLAAKKRRGLENFNSEIITQLTRIKELDAALNILKKYHE